MKPEELKTFFINLGARNQQQPFKTWNQLLQYFNTLDPKDGCAYMISSDKGTDNEKRSRFLTHTEALEVIITEVEKENARTDNQKNQIDS